ncbi:MAG: YceI family protein [Pseudomonadota bacterium]
MILFWAHAAIAEKWTVVEHGKSLTFSVLTEVPNGDEMVRLDGRFPEWTSDIYIDFEDLTKSRIRINVDITAVELRRPSLKAELFSPNWFHAVRHPTAVFISQSIDSTEVGFEANGTLSLKGISAPVSLGFEVTRTGDLIRAVGSVSLDRLVWRIGTSSPASVVESDVAVAFDFRARN